MYTSKMTYQEMLMEFVKDNKSCENRVQYLMPKVSHIVKKCKKYPFALHFVYKTPQGNECLIMIWFRYKPKRDTERINYGMSIIGTYKNSIGQYVAVTHNNYDQSISVYPAHFFDRYAKRTKMSKTGIDLIADYFCRINHQVHGFKKSKDGSKLMVVNNAGVLFGTFIRGDIRHICFKTFVGRGMLFDNQEDDIKKIAKDFYGDLKEWEYQEERDNWTHIKLNP